jgi:hypothetical protein
MVPRYICFLEKDLDIYVRKEEGILSEVKAKSLTSKPFPGCIGFLLALGVHVFHTELNHQNYWKRPVQLFNMYGHMSKLAED